MSSVDRQNKLIAAEDWKKIYQSFKNADFQSYDFDNLRRSMITYLRENYPEDFNDYIESSEYLALIDLIAYLGQNLAFRFDLNARDNFLELAERRESVLRLARLVSYNAKRNQCANGLLKFTSVLTTETILDSNGRDLANQTIVWNDSANSNWYEQFIKIINAALPDYSQFGKPQDKATISGITTEQYRFNANNSEIPVYSFNKNIDGRNVNFEVVSSTFRDSDKIYEEAPFPGNNFAFLYRDDGGGAASSSTGFFAHFRQGSLQQSAFKIVRPSTNQTIDIDTSNINNDDVWLYGLDSVGVETDLWAKVDAVEGNNIIYNSVSKNIRKIYSVLTRTGDRARLVFADGVFGDLPQGNFKVYFRTSNGLSYSINPTDIRNVSIDIPYISAAGKAETLTVNLGLKYTVTNAAAAETSDDVKTNAPATYYTQGRMVTGEDYNVLPSSINQDIIKVKSVNRVSSGISRYFDFKDTSGKYSTTNLFGTDGIIYKEHITNVLSFGTATRTDIENSVINQVEPLLSSTVVKNFYLDVYTPITLTYTNVEFYQQTSQTNSITGYIRDITDGTIKRLGSYSVSDLKYVVPGAMVRFVPPAGKKFNANGELVNIADALPEDKDYLWTKVVNVVGDGTANSTGLLDTGYGPVELNDIIPTGAVLNVIIPNFETKLRDDIRIKIVELIFARKNFGIRYDTLTTSWKIVSEANLDKKSSFSLGKTGDTTSQNLDSSWIVLAETNGQTYTITSRGTRYIFESEKEIRFFFDSSDKVYDSSTGKIVRDKITVLGINTQPDAIATYNLLLPFNNDFNWEIVDDYKGADGYIDTKKISVSFFDSDEDGVVDDPDLFRFIVSPTVNPTRKYIFLQRRQSLDGAYDYYYVPNVGGLIRVYQSQNDIVISELTDGQLVYIINENVVKNFYKATSSFTINVEYKGFIGRAGLKFQYVHAADSTSRIDPAATNIMDVYMLTKSYDTQYRRWLKGDLTDKPLPPSSDALHTSFNGNLSKVKAISDEIIYHPVKYKNLFGSKADSSLQATFKVVKTSSVVSDNDIKTSVISAINEFFSIENWDFGDTFSFGELATYIMTKMSPNISNIVIVPKHQSLSFGSLYEIKSNADEIFASSATVDDVEIISEITATRIKAAGTVVTNTTGQTGGITSA